VALFLFDFQRTQLGILVSNPIKGNGVKKKQYSLALKWFPRSVPIWTGYPVRIWCSKVQTVHAAFFLLNTIL
jgi:hypothetical protein